MIARRSRLSNDLNPPHGPTGVSHAIDFWAVADRGDFAIVMRDLAYDAV